MLRRIILLLLTLLALTPPQLIAQSPVVAQVRGTVFDSVAMAPLAGALVRIVRADDPAVGRTAYSDSTGAFAHDSVPAGVWLASFLHPTLDSLRLEPGIVRLDITDSGTVVLHFATPSGRALIALACGPGRAAEEGVIIGEVRTADSDELLAGAEVEVEWPEWMLGKKTLTTELSYRRAITNMAGRYTLCGVPAGSTLRTRGWWQADSAGFVEVVVPATGYAVQDFHIGEAVAVTAVTARSGDSTDATPLRTGRAVVRGRITTTGGAPLPNALVHVLGSGSTVRSGDSGEFRIGDAVSGTQSVEVRAIGYSPVRRTVRLRTTDETQLTLSLATRTVELDTVRVVAGKEVPWDVRAIERRWRTGLGRFLDGRTVVDRSTMYTTDALRGMAGVSIRMADAGFGQDVIMRGNGGGECRASVFVDGMPFDAAGRGGITLDEFVRPGEVAAVEVYSRPTMVPAEYMTMMRGCGVLAVWTKQGTGNVPVLPPKSAR